jgi:hypothetical protein
MKVPPLLSDAEWISHKTPPALGQLVIGKSKSMDGEEIFYCGEFTGITTKSIMIKTWHYVEDFMGDNYHRKVVCAPEWLPLTS